MGKAIGTYTSTYNAKLGKISIWKTASGDYQGKWGETDSKRHGSLELRVAEDGKTVHVKWKALDGDEAKPKEGESTWRRKAM